MNRQGQSFSDMTAEGAELKLADKLLELSQTDDQTVLAATRIMRDVFPQFSKWLSVSRSRNLGNVERTADDAKAVASLCASMCTSYALTSIQLPPGLAGLLGEGADLRTNEARASMISYLRRELNDHLEALERQAAAGELGDDDKDQGP